MSLPLVLPREFESIDTAALSMAKGWQAKYKLLIGWGKALSDKPWLRQDEYRVRGCDTSLWLYAEQRDGHCYFAADGESRIIKGLAALLLAQVDGAAPRAILALDLQHLLQSYGLQRHLAPSRSNGFAALVTRVQDWVREWPEPVLTDTVQLPVNRP